MGEANDEVEESRRIALVSTSPSGIDLLEDGLSLIAENCETSCGREYCSLGPSFR
jgi:hypothetical protein